MFTILRHSITIKRIKWYFHAARDAALTGNIIMLSFVYYYFFLSSGFENRKDDSYVVMKSCDEEKGIFHLFYIFFFLFWKTTYWKYWNEVFYNPFYHLNKTPLRFHYHSDKKTKKQKNKNMLSFEWFCNPNKILSPFEYCLLFIW